MYNWNTDVSKWNKRSSSFIIWKLEQLINFGLNGQKLNLQQLKKFWPQLTLDPQRKKFMELTLWPERF